MFYSGSRPPTPSHFPTYLFDCCQYYWSLIYLPLLDLICVKLFHVFALILCFFSLTQDFCPLLCRYFVPLLASFLSFYFRYLKRKSSVPAFRCTIDGFFTYSLLLKKKKAYLNFFPCFTSRKSLIDGLTWLPTLNQRLQGQA